MKIEKINNDKVKITLTIEELASRKISPADLQSNKPAAQVFFFKLLEESELEDEFLEESSKLFIEASTLNDLFMVVITKIYDLPNNDNYISSKHNTVFRITSNIYEFKELENLLMFSKFVNRNIYFGINSLFLYNDSYYIVFSNSTIKNPKFVKSFLLTSEYCDNYYKKQSLLNLINEYGTCIIEKNAITTLSKI